VIGVDKTLEPGHAEEPGGSVASSRERRRRFGR
jgi:hypothetical protein